MSKAVEDLYQATLKKEADASFKAEIYKAINVITVMFLILSGAFISILATSAYPWRNAVLIVLGLTISTLKTLAGIFMFEQKATTYKQASIKLRKLLRTILTVEQEDSSKISESLKQLYEDFDDLDMFLFEEGSLGKLVDQNSTDNSPHGFITQRLPNNSVNINNSDHSPLDAINSV